MTRFNREIAQLSDSIATMQNGLQQLVTQVSDATTAMVENIGALAQGNHARRGTGEIARGQPVDMRNQAPQRGNYPSGHPEPDGNRNSEQQNRRKQEQRLQTGELGNYPVAALDCAYQPAGRGRSLRYLSWRDAF